MITKCLRIFILAYLFLMQGVWLAEAQTKNQPTWITFSAGHQEYIGDFGNEITAFEVGYDWTLGLELDQYLNSILDFELSTDYAELDYPNAFSTTIINANFMLNVKPIRSEYRINPFFGAGFGVTPYWNNGAPAKNGIALHLPVQAGFDVQLNENIAVGIKARYIRTFSDDIDGRSGEFDMDGINHDDFIVYSAGFKISINRTRDKDGDGISDRNDLCPDAYGTSFWGCPDSDGDGIPDNEDACPDAPASRALNGCPVSDGGVITDNEDADGDVPTDNKDADGDGITDTEDDCPQQAGTAVNNGCPEKEQKQLVENRKQDLQKLSAMIQFEANSSIIDSSSYGALNQLAQYLQNDQDLRLIIRGHAYSMSSASKNLELSTNRANAVKEYLVKQGIQANRIASFGYGDTRPEALSENQEGREQERNSRIELHLYSQ